MSHGFPKPPRDRRHHRGRIARRRPRGRPHHFVSYKDILGRLYTKNYIVAIWVLVFTNGFALGQNKIGQIDVALLFDSLPDALALREKFHETLDAAQEVQRLQFDRMLNAAYPEVPSTLQKPREDFRIFFPKVKEEAQNQARETLAWLLEQEAALLQPLMAEVDLAIENVRLELQLDTILRTNACPFDMWGPRISYFFSPQDGKQWIIPAKSYRFPPKAACPNFDTLLAVNPEVIDIAPFVLKKLHKL